MTQATHVSLALARFDTMRHAFGPAAPLLDDALFHALGADTRAAATEPAFGEAFTVMSIGLHRDEASAHRVMDAAQVIAPGLGEAAELWRAVLRPFRHTGAANYLDRNSPGEVFGE